MIEEWEESRIKTKEEVRLEQEKKAWKDLMNAINTIGGIQSEPVPQFYRQYHRYWNILIDRARIYQKIAKLDEKYGLDLEDK